MALSAMSTAHVGCLLAAFALGHNNSAEAHRRVLERQSEATPAQTELQDSLVLLAGARAAIFAALDVLEQHGHGGVVHLCRRIIAEPLCVFEGTQRWGVCAWTGRAVNRMLTVRVGGSEIALDDKFARFVMSLWSASHFELVESSRPEYEDEPDLVQVEPVDLVACYVAAFAEVQECFALTVGQLNTLGPHAREEL